MPKQPPESETPALAWWTISKFAAKLQWVGEVEAVDQREAIEKAAEQFKVPAAKLLATRRR
jgi:hypothetical protein